MSLALAQPPRAPLVSGLAASLAHERDFGRFVLWLPVCAATGVAAAEALPATLPLPWLGAAVAVLLLLRFLALLRGAGGVAAVLMALAAGGLGALSFEASSALSGTPMLTRATTMDVSGQVVAAERRGAERGRIVVALTDPDGPRRVRLSFRGATLPPVGSTIAAKARLFPVRGPTIPGSYDPARRLYFDGIGATGFVYGAVTVTAPADGSVRSQIAAFREAVGARVLAAGGEHAAFSLALLTGERGLMDETTVTALRHSGLGHILAISGLHMALVAGSVFGAVRLALALVPRVALSIDTRAIAAIAGLAAGTLYLALSGGAIATQRAYIMLCVALLAVLSHRPALTMRAVAVAATLLIVLDPVAVLEPGFQMSFLAVIALIGTYEAWSLRPKARRIPLPVAFLIGVGVTSLVAGLATAIPSAYHFQRLAPLGLLANLLAMPVFSLLAMPAGIIALALMPLGLEGLPLAAMNLGLSGVTAIAALATALSGDAGAVGMVPAEGALLASFGLLFLCLMTARWRRLGLLPLAAGVAMMALAPRPDVLIAADGKSVAALTPSGPTVLQKSGGYPADQFRRALGAPTAPEGGRCDADGCVLNLHEGALSRALTLRGATEDCGRATVIVSAERLYGCRAPVVLDRDALTTHGAAILWLHGETIRVRRARPDGPVKPWHVPLAPAR